MGCGPTSEMGQGGWPEADGEALETNKRKAGISMEKGASGRTHLGLQ